MKFAPVVLFVYNRPDHTKKTVEALILNSEAMQTRLIIYSDAPRDKTSTENVNLVRKYINSIRGFQHIEIIKQNKNLGLANSIIHGVTEVVNKYGRIIVLEDDLVVSPFFLKYMNEALEKYRDEDSVISIHGYNYPINEVMPAIFFIKGADCWGWATWKRGWDLFEIDGKKLLQNLKNKKLLKRFDFYGSYNYTRMLKNQIMGKNNSWAVRWYASALLADKLTLYPGLSLVTNIGFDGTGTHFNHTAKVLSDSNHINSKYINLENIEIEENNVIFEYFRKYLALLQPSYFELIKRKIIFYINKVS